MENTLNAAIQGKTSWFAAFSDVVRRVVLDSIREDRQECAVALKDAGYIAAADFVERMASHKELRPFSQSKLRGAA